MQFHDFTEAWPLIKGLLGKHDVQFRSAKEFYHHFEHLTAIAEDQFGYRQARHEYSWISKNRPYYNVWPAIIPLLLKLDLSKVQSMDVRPIVPDLLVRLPAEPEKNPLKFKWNDREYYCRVIMISFSPVNETKGGPQTEGLAIWCDFGERMSLHLGDIECPTCPIYTFRCFPRIPNHTIEKVMADLPFAHPDMEQGVIVPNEFIDDMIRLSCCLCLIGNDPTLITPDVLGKDRSRFTIGDKDLQDRLVAKAIRRGKLAWNVGKDIEVSPHYRRAHPALVWTGVGRRIPKIVGRKGSIIHRDKISKIPTGHIND